MPLTDVPFKPGFLTDAPDREAGMLGMGGVMAIEKINSVDRK